MSNLFDSSRGFTGSQIFSSNQLENKNQLLRRELSNYYTISMANNIFKTKTEFNNDIDEINNNITTINNQLITLDNDIITVNNKGVNLANTVNDYITSNDNTINNINNDITTINNNITTNTNNINNISNQITTINNNVTTNTNNINTINSDITTINNNLNNEVNSLNSQISFVDMKVSQNTTDIINLETTTNNNLNNVNNDITNLNNSLGEFNNVFGEDTINFSKLTVINGLHINNDIEPDEGYFLVNESSNNRSLRIGIRDNTVKQCSIELNQVNNINNTSRIRFLTNSLNGINAIDRMVIDHLGRVGIGITNPTSLLTVNGDSKFNGIISLDKFLNLYEESTNSSYTKTLLQSSLVQDNTNINETETGIIIQMQGHSTSGNLKKHTLNISGRVNFNNYKKYLSIDLENDEIEINGKTEINGITEINGNIEIDGNIISSGRIYSNNVPEYNFLTCPNLNFSQGPIQIISAISNINYPSYITQPGQRFYIRISHYFNLENRTTFLNNELSFSLQIKHNNQSLYQTLGSYEASISRDSNESDKFLYFTHPYSISWIKDNNETQLNIRFIVNSQSSQCDYTFKHIKYHIEFIPI